MKQKQWKYKIDSGKTPVIIMSVMVVLFGSITLWLYKTNNAAVIFLGVLTVLMTLILILTIYRLLFYKVLIGENGFYYQTSINNGKYFAYTDVENAWINSGQAQNGAEMQYCNIAISSETVIRFQFYYKDEKSIKYLIEKVKNADNARVSESVNEKDEYLIDGKVFGKAKIASSIVIVAMLIFINVFIIKQIGFNFMVVPSIIIDIAVIWLMFNNILFFRVKIEKDGFYCRTTPFNGKYYKYDEIVSCRETKKVVRHHHYGHGSSHIMHYFFFEFTDINGKKHKFQYEQQIHEHEINVLKERIKSAKS